VLDAPLVTAVTSAAQAPVAVHVTSEDAWRAIQSDGCLKAGQRTHIHFATSRAQARANTWATVFLRLCVADALRDDVPLWLSSNGVLLTKGPLPVKYVEQAAAFDDVATGRDAAADPEAAADRPGSATASAEAATQVGVAGEVAESTTTAIGELQEPQQVLGKRRLDSEVVHDNVTSEQLPVAL